MKEEPSDPLKNLLSDLPAPERAELERTWSLTGAAADPPHAPHEVAAAYDLVQRRLGFRRGPWVVLKRAAVVAAAITAGIVIGWTIFDSDQTASQTGSDGRDHYLILIRNDADSAKAIPPRQVVDEFRQWAVSLIEEGRLVDGAELDDGGIEMSGPGSHADVAELVPREDQAAGYFIIRANSLKDAEGVARGCPQLRHGGSIEVRRIKRGR